MAAAEPQPIPPRRAGPVPALVGRPLEPVYRLVIGWRNRRFDAGRGVNRLDVPVISVGNISVGGTGKTPMVAHIVSTLLRDGGTDPAGRIRPCIAMRGYVKGPRRAAEPDETDAYRRAFPDVPIVAEPDRLAGLKRLFARIDASHRPTCVVLDDGFQHRRIARDLDIVLIDASRPPTRDRLLPAGYLREPVESLKRADVVVMTHAELVDAAALAATIADLRSRAGRDVDVIARHVWTAMVTGDDHEPSQLLPLDTVLGRRVVACCAIGNPDGFLHSLRATLGADGTRPGTLAGALVLPDHDPYGPEIVTTLAAMAADERAEAIVVTDKDWSKLRRVPRERWRGVPILRPVLAMVFDRGQDELDRRVIACARRSGVGGGGVGCGGGGVKPAD